MTIKLSRRKEMIAQSEIRSMSQECSRIGGINMAQGVCDLEVPACVIEGAARAMKEGYNIYTPCEGLPELRRAISEKTMRFYGRSVDPDSGVMVSAGATGAFYASALALLDPGDEVILFEPYYGYHVSTLLSMGCVPRFVRLDPPQWELNMNALEMALTGKTKAIVLNSPANPSGKVFSREELSLISDLVNAHDLILFSDEIYEHFIYEGLSHLPPATVPGLEARTVTISGLSKLFSITGWRIGYAMAPPEVITAASHFNDLIYVCAPSPLQIGAASGLLDLGPDYYETIANDHLEKRDLFCAALSDAGLTPYVPKGAYYVLADISRVPGSDDKERVMHILEKTGVAAVPGRAFYHDDSGRDLARFCFAKEMDVLVGACERIRGIK